MQTCKQLSESDNERRLQFYHAINEFAGTEQLDLNIIFSDETHIYLNGFINQRNFRKWSSEKSREVFEKILH